MTGVLPTIPVRASNVVDPNTLYLDPDSSLFTHKQIKHYQFFKFILRKHILNNYTKIMAHEEMRWVNL